MKFLPKIIILYLNWLSILSSTGLFLLLSFTAQAKVVYLNSQQDFDQAHDSAAMNDTLVWRSGTYEDIYMNISADHLCIKAETLGGVIFTGASRVNITGDYITLEGFQFLDGDIGSNDVIHTRGSYNVFTQINIRAYRSYKYLRVREESRYAEITYCNFENRLNLDDQNILSILVDDTNPGYHKIQYCSFKNFDGTGNDLGIEPIRIGVSTQADFISRSLVEYCYFTQCNGDGELISSKATQNVYRYNTFENNPLAELVLRHGSEAIVYGNFFINGKGGVRVREGQDHYIYNNYFYEIDDRAIYLQNEDSDPLDNINIAFNTIVDCSEVILGGDGSDRPTHVTLANNIFSDPDDNLFEDPTGTETWIGNLAFGDLGIPLPSTGLRVMDPSLVSNDAGYFGLGENSPAIDAAQVGYAPLPQFEGMDMIDTELSLDLMGQSRPMSIADKDLGCNEYPHTIKIQPIATEENTGPSYNTSTTTSTQNNTIIVQDLMELNPNPVSTSINLSIKSENKSDLVINLYNIDGSLISTIVDKPNFVGQTNVSQQVLDLPAGIYMVHAQIRSIHDGISRVQTIRFVKR